MTQLSSTLQRGYDIAFYTMIISMSGYQLLGSLKESPQSTFCPTIPHDLWAVGSSIFKRYLFRYSASLSTTTSHYFNWTTKHKTIYRAVPKIYLSASKVRIRLCLGYCSDIVCLAKSFTVAARYASWRGGIAVLWYRFVSVCLSTFWICDLWLNKS